jgi:hypothetical protein
MRVVIMGHQWLSAAVIKDDGELPETHLMKEAIKGHQ